MIGLRTSLDHEKVLIDIAHDGEAAGRTFRVLSEILIEEMELLHGQKFQAVIDHDVPMILIRLK